MTWLYALLITAPLVLAAWGLMDKGSPRTFKAFWSWWASDGLMIFIVIFIFVALWLGRHSPPDVEEMITPQYP